MGTPVTMLISWCVLITLTPVMLWINTSRSGLDELRPNVFE